MKCDIAVVGAGAAGIAAAISAANAGMQVVLVEQDGFTGGLATSAMVGTICGLYYRNNDTKVTAPRFAVQGFARHFAEQIAVKSSSSPMKFAQGLYFLPYKISTFHDLAYEQLGQANVQVLLNTKLNNVLVADGKVVELRLRNNNQSITLSPKVVIDCSGCAIVSSLARFKLIEQKNHQSCAFVFQVSGLPPLPENILKLNFIRWIKRGIDHGDLDKDCDRLSFIPGTVTNGQGLLKLGLSSFINEDKQDIHKYEEIARARSENIIAFLNRTEVILEKLSITMMAKQVGVRSGPRPQGLKSLEEQQVLECIKGDDGVAIGAWPIEYWGKRKVPEMDYFAENDFYLIPAPTLVSRSVINLFFAGRAISATEYAIASARVIGTCLSTGYAAGIMAAEYVNNSGNWQTAIAKIRLNQVFSKEG